MCIYIVFNIYTLPVVINKNTHIIFKYIYIPSTGTEKMDSFFVFICQQKIHQERTTYIVVIWGNMIHVTFATAFFRLKATYKAEEK